MQHMVRHGLGTCGQGPACPALRKPCYLPMDGLPSGCVLHLQPCLPKDIDDCVVAQKVTWNTKEKVGSVTCQVISNWGEPQASDLHQS